MEYAIDPNARYAETHEWARKEGELIVVGVSDYAQHELSDVVYADLPAPGDDIIVGEALGAVESVKAAEDVLSPVGGEAVEVNGELADHPELINQDPYGKAWLVKIRPTHPEQFDKLMDAKEYEEFLAKEQ
ncbi:MAG TPA: glycine cleavage system protein GcvH [Armatimonadota bacterium]|jgi:glycine cleavage system H protein